MSLANWKNDGNISKTLGGGEGIRLFKFYLELRNIYFISIMRRPLRSVHSLDRILCYGGGGGGGFENSYVGKEEGSCEERFSNLLRYQCAHATKNQIQKYVCSLYLQRWFPTLGPRVPFLGSANGLKLKKKEHQVESNTLTDLYGKT